MSVDCAYLLVSHGSRDPRPEQAVQQLVQYVHQQWQMEQPSSYPLIITACLELAGIPLHQRIIQIIQETGMNRLKILPLFLLSGIHVQEDIPIEIQLAKTRLGDQIQLDLLPYLGSNPLLIPLLKNNFQDLSSPLRIFLSHGSRYRDSSLYTETLAEQLSAIPAYWSISPSLPVIIEQLVQKGYEDMAILPYFLFHGGLSDAIELQVESLRKTFKNLTLNLGQPLGATPELAKIIFRTLTYEKDQLLLD